MINVFILFFLTFGFAIGYHLWYRYSTNETIRRQEMLIAEVERIALNHRDMDTSAMQLDSIVRNYRMEQINAR